MLPKAPKHNRMKPKWKPQANAAEIRFREWVRGFGCLVCGRVAEIHHIISDGFKRISKCHWRIVPLCSEHHRGTSGYHGLGSDRLFTTTYGIKLYDKALWFRELYREQQGGE